MASTGRERRSYLEIIASILDVCHDWTRKTRVMYECNMSSLQFAGYLDLLLGANLLLIENDHQSLLLRISSKGKEFLKAYDRLENLME